VGTDTLFGVDRAAPEGDMTAITMPDGSVRVFSSETTGGDITDEYNNSKHDEMKKVADKIRNGTVYSNNATAMTVKDWTDCVKREGIVCAEVEIDGVNPLCDCHQSKGNNLEIPHAWWCKTKENE